MVGHSGYRVGKKKVFKSKGLRSEVISAIRSDSFEKPALRDGSATVT